MDFSYINRELSWLEFNGRVLQEALDPSTPLLEKVKFLGIFTSNLDEFFMVRVAGLKKMQQEGILKSDSPGETNSGLVLKQLRKRTTQFIEKQYHGLESIVLPQLSKRGIKLFRYSDLKSKQKKFVDEYFEHEVFPVLTPLSYDAAHPFPFFTNLASYFVVVHENSRLDVNDERMNLCFVEIPRVLNRLIQIPSPEGSFHYVLLDEVIKGNLSRLFLGVDITDAYPFRVTRNLDYDLLENEVVDLVQSMKLEMINREHQEAVRLEYDQGMPESVLHKLLHELDLIPSEAFATPYPLFLPSLSVMHDLPFSDLKFPPFNPRLPSQFSSREDIFSIISSGDLLVHHPYESFYAVTEFLTSAARDPQVVAIKQTLYRTVGDSPIINSLIEAAENGKHVTAVIELKARFDEKNNMVWARRLERAGVNVVFGFVGLKTHCKATLVIRRESKKLVRYAHLSTGNYNPDTAQMYADLGLFTVNPDLTYDVSVLFNLVTGYNILSQKSAGGAVRARPKLTKVAIAPLNLRQTLLKLIDGEIANQKKYGNGLIVAKLNALVDQPIIDALYKASAAGVSVRLLIRGICCLKPGVKGMSENIQVISIVDRFLEHARVLHFHANGKDKVFLSSADWMPRNMQRRIELMFPIEDPGLKRRILDEILATAFSDNVKAQQMQPDGTYVRVKAPRKATPVRSQFAFIDMVREEGIRTKPYEIAIRHQPQHKGERPVLTTKKARKTKS